MATQHVKIKVNNNNQVKFNVQPQKVKFNVGINGRPGKDGETSSISIGEVITGAPEHGAFVEVDPSSVLPNQILNFVIPQGYPGIDGKDGQDGNDGRDGAPGQDGYTPIKGVDYFDGLPGLNGKDGYTPVKGVDYFDGLDGKPGKDGYTPIKGVDYFDGEQGIQGPAGKDGDVGPQGPQGNPGYTPVRGVDYFTIEDQTTIKNDIVEELNPTLENNLKESKNYADSIKPTKTSQLTNDSNFATTSENNNFSVGQTINGTLTVNGDIVQNGTAYETHAEKVFTKNDEIITREGATGGLEEGEYTGIQAQKYDGTNNGRLGFNANGEARVGDIGDEQPLLTRDEITNLQTGQVLTWDGDNLKAIGSSEYVKDTDYATSSKGGVVRINPSYGVARNTTNHSLYVNAATNTEIDAKSSVYKPIVPSNLEYAVKSIGDGYYIKNDEYATKTTAGVVKASEGGGIGASSTGNLFTIPATNEDIDAKTNAFKPIVSSNLDYAVKSVGDGYYVKNDEYATTSTVGVVKANGSGGITVNSAGNISVVKATEGEIDAKTNSYKVIVPANLDYAVKSVGDGYYVTKDDYMTDSNFGVAKVASGLGIWVNANHALYVAKASDAEIDAKSNSYKPIVPANLDYAVKSVGGIVIDCTDTIYPTMDDIPRFNALGNAITDGKYDGSCVGKFKVQYLINGTTSVIVIMEQYLYGTTLYQKIESSTNAYYIRPSTVSYWSIYHHSAIVDNLTSNSGTTALSGKQGKILNDRLTAVENSQVELTQSEYDEMLAAGEINNEVYYNIVEE